MSAPIVVQDVRKTFARARSMTSSDGLAASLRAPAVNIFGDSLFACGGRSTELVPLVATSAAVVAEHESRGLRVTLADEEPAARSAVEEPGVNEAVANRPRRPFRADQRLHALELFTSHDGLVIALEGTFGTADDPRIESVSQHYMGLAPCPGAARS